MYFEVVGDIRDVEVIAKGVSVRARARLRARYGAGRWRKMKGTAYVAIGKSPVVLAEVHWYEAHGIGRRNMKIKRFFDE